MMQEFVDSVNRTAKKAVSEIHTAVPAVITAFDAGKGLATVQPKAKFKKPNGDTIDYPSIGGVPVVFPQSQNVTIAFPIKAGDNCLLVFGEKALDYWLYGKETDTELNFDLSNAIAIPSLATSGNAAMQTACAEDAAVVQAGDTILKVKGDAVYIKGDVKIEGDVEVTGKITATADVLANSRVSLATHTHTGDSGGSTSAPR